MGGCYSASSQEAFKSPKHKAPKERSFGKGPFKTHNKLKEGKEAKQNEDKSFEEEKLLNNAVNISSNEKKCVVPSDSGIDSLAPNSVKGESDSDGCKEGSPNNTVNDEWYNECTEDENNENTRTDNNEETKNENATETETYCSCGPRQANNQTWQNTKCTTHINMASPRRTRNSELVNLKSSFKDFMKKTDKQVRLSWKSTDSLDINRQLTTHLDRTKSEASEIFKDDLSFCAPLAHFDSLGGNLDSQNRVSALSTASEIETVARDICNCDFYANNLVNELDNFVPERNEEFNEDSSPDSKLEKNISTEDIHIDESYDLESKVAPVTGKKKDNQVIKQMSLSSLRPSLSSLADVTLTTYEGKEMVIIEADVYKQILEELSLLKSKLSQLTAVIEEDEALRLNDAYCMNISKCLLNESINDEQIISVENDS